MPETTEEDRVEARAYATGSPVPRLLACPGGQTFNPESGSCESENRDGRGVVYEYEYYYEEY